MARQAPWNAAYSAYGSAQDAAKAATTAKQGTRATYETELRSAAGMIQANPAVPDADLATIGLPIHKTSRTPAPLPATQPVIDLDTSIAFQHTIHFRDKGSHSKAKPKGVRGCEIWCAAGPHPEGPKSCHFIGLDTKTPHITHFEATIGG